VTDYSTEHRLLRKLIVTHQWRQCRPCMYLDFSDLGSSPRDCWRKGLPGFVPFRWVIPSRRILIKLKTKAALFFEMSGKAVIPKHGATNQTSWYLNVKISLRLIKCFSALPFAAVSAPVVQDDPAAPSYFSLHFCVSLITLKTRSARSVAVIFTALVRFKGRADN
jgi:hypothetical protein